MGTCAQSSDVDGELPNAEPMPWNPVRAYLGARNLVRLLKAYATPDENKRLTLMLEHLFAEGFLMVGTCTGMLSTPMTESEVDALVAAMESGFRRIAAA